MGRPQGGHNRSTWDAAEIIWDALWETPKVGVTKREVMHEHDLTSSQFNSGLRLIKQEFQESKSEPVTYDPRTHRYRLDVPEREARHYIVWKLGHLLTRHETERPFLASLRTKFGDDRRFRRLERYNEEAIDTLEEWIEEARP